MKALTHEDWMKNPTPRMMWVWDGNERNKVTRKVIYFNENKRAHYPIIALSENGVIPSNYMHCAEIAKTRRMTNKELSRWLKENPTRECKYTFDDYIYSVHMYIEESANEEVHEDIRIRENDGEWREPLVEVEE